MGDHLKKVARGDPLRIPARTFNTFVDAGRDFQQRQQDVSRQGQRMVPSCAIIPVRNDSGADRARFEILGIDEPVFTPDADEDAFKQRIALKGVTPAEDTHEGKFVVLLEPVATGEVASAVVAGVSAVRVDMAKEHHLYAEIAGGDAGKLALALILWVESGTGVKWAVVRLGARRCAGDTIFEADHTGVQGCGNLAFDACGRLIGWWDASAVWHALDGERDEPTETTQMDLVGYGTW